MGMPEERQAPWLVGIIYRYEKACRTWTSFVTVYRVANNAELKNVGDPGY